MLIYVIYVIHITGFALIVVGINVIIEPLSRVANLFKQQDTTLRIQNYLYLCLALKQWRLLLYKAMSLNYYTEKRA